MPSRAAQAGITTAPTLGRPISHRASDERMENQCLRGVLSTTAAGDSSLTRRVTVRCTRSRVQVKVHSTVLDEQPGLSNADLARWAFLTRRA
jgi:hypothetical protein